MSVEALRVQFETNVFGWHAVVRRVLPGMRAAGEGRIVQNSSVLGLVALRYRGAYVASKFAIEALTDAMRLELRGSGVRISLIEPGPITSRFRANAHEAFRRHIDVEASPHRDVYRAVMGRLESGDEKAPFELPESAVVAKLVHALESPRPKLRYRVTVPTHALAFLKRGAAGRRARRGAERDLRRGASRNRWRLTAPAWTGEDPPRAALGPAWVFGRGRMDSRLRGNDINCVGAITPVTEGVTSSTWIGSSLLPSCPRKRE